MRSAKTDTGKSLGEVLRQRRGTLSIGKYSRGLGTNKQSLERLEAGTHWTFERLVKIARGLGVHPLNLLREAGGSGGWNIGDPPTGARITLREAPGVTVPVPDKRVAELFRYSEWQGGSPKPLPSTLSSFSEIVGRELQRKCEERELSARYFSEEVDIHEVYIGEMYRGGRWTFQRLEQVSAFFGVSPPAFCLDAYKHYSEWSSGPPPVGHRVEFQQADWALDILTEEISQAVCHLTWRLV